MNSSTTNSTTPSIWTECGLEVSMLCINFLFGLPAHSYVFWVILTGSKSDIASEFFTLSLSLCEIGTCLDGLTFILAFYNSCFWMLSQFLRGLAITGRPLFQCLICVERYLAVVHPVTFLKSKPLRYRLICCVVAWMFTLSSCFCCMALLMLFPMYAHGWFFSTQFVIFFSIQLFCLVTVLQALKQSGPGDRGRNRNEENHMKRRAFNLILISTVNMATAYVPYTFISIFLIVTQQNITVLWFVTVFCYVLAGFIQSALYLHRAGKLSCLYLK